LAFYAPATTVVGSLLLDPAVFKYPYDLARDGNPRAILKVESPPDKRVDLMVYLPTFEALTITLNIFLEES
jgi:hypothetical protein